MKYSNEEKLSIIARYQQGESIATLSDELNIPRSTLYLSLIHIYASRTERHGMRFRPKEMVA